MICFQEEKEEEPALISDAENDVRERQRAVGEPSCTRISADLLLHLQKRTTVGVKRFTDRSSYRTDSHGYHHA